MARKSMPKPLDAPWKKSRPKPWADPDQWQYLKGGIPGYRVAQATKGKKAAINNFLEEFLPLWWDKFLLKGNRTAAMDHKHIKEWYQNHGSVKKATTSVHIHDIFPKQQSCVLKAEKMYSQKYYESRVKPMVDEKKKGATLEMFAAEADDIREEILMETKEQPTLVPGKDGVMTPEMYATYVIALKAAPKQIDVFIKALAEATGCSILLIFGGPDPWDEKGKISMYGYWNRFHAGKEQQGWTFGQVFPNFRETYLSLFTSRKVRVAHILGGNTTMAEKQKDMVEGMGDMDVDGNAGPAAEQNEMVGGKELSQNGQIDEVQTNEPHSNAKSNDRGDHQEEEPEREANPEDDNPMPYSPRAPTPVPSSPPASPTNSREISQAPASPHMNELNSNLVVISVQDNISNTFESSDRLIMQGKSNTVKSNTVKCPHTCPMHTAVEDGLVMTREKRVRSRPAPKEILTLAE
ncbi:hypothetical protein EDD85DRAFT_958042 [Armillaria nabsnona]|nr:hypothetical protein EDD85DRAFT_958042 [Armillaria nabsnona]